MDTRREKLEALKKEKNAVIMAHYYVPDEVQEIADYIGDSYYLSDVATKVDASVIVLCGVRFMGESAKILNPGKKVLLPAHMAAIEKIEEVRKEYPDVAVVCYVNSTAELKSHSDVCVTSSNAVKIVKELPNHDIFFIPDEHLGTYVAEQVPEKHIILNDGFCHVHAATELGVFAELKKRCPDKKFYAVGNTQICPNMKKVTLDKLIEALENEENEVLLSEQEISDAHAPLLRMLELAK